MNWRSLLFVHWRVDAAALAPLLPRGVTIDTFDGSAWVGLVPFTMDGIRLRGFPPLPTMHAFHECNVRTYVSFRGESGVWFLSLDATSRLAVWGARRFWHLNYILSRITIAYPEPNEIHYRVERCFDPATTMRCAWRVGEQLPPSSPGELMHFLTERYVLFTSRQVGNDSVAGAAILRGAIDHQPWSLRRAELLELDDELVAASGIGVGDQEPIVFAADPIAVHAWPLERG